MTRDIWADYPSVRVVELISTNPSLENGNMATLGQLNSSSLPSVGMDRSKFAKVLTQGPFGITWSCSCRPTRLFVMSGTIDTLAKKRQGTQEVFSPQSEGHDWHSCIFYSSHAGQG